MPWDDCCVSECISLGERVHFRSEVVVHHAGSRLEDVDVGFEFVTINFLTLFLILFTCLIAHTAVQTVTRCPAPKLSEIQNLVNGESLLNERQCLDLSSKLSETIRNIQVLVSPSTDLFRPSPEHLYRVLVKARILVNDCSRQGWIAAAVFHVQNENAFHVILLELGLCYHAIYEQSKGMRERWNLQVEGIHDSSTCQSAHIDGE